MQHRLYVPANTEASETIPSGAVILGQGGTAVVYYNRQLSYADSCKSAIQRGKRIELPEGAQCVGWFDERDGEIHLQPQSSRLLASWVGHPLYRNDLECTDNRHSRRQQARRLTMQGRTAEAFMLDRRLGL